MSGNNAFVSSIATLLITSSAVLGLAWLALRRADGPIGPLAGGALRTGPLLDPAHTQWSTLIAPETVQVIELQLEQPVSSRLVGVFVHEGKLYAACDLGFVGYRAPGRIMALIQGIVLTVKRWHLHAERDGRVVVRLAGNRYRCQAQRVKDQNLQATFEALALKNGERFFGTLRPPRRPGTIWFFQLAPRD